MNVRVCHRFAVPTSRARHAQTLLCARVEQPIPDVIPAQAEIHFALQSTKPKDKMDPRFRWDDDAF
jgi:hypothetical protein